MALKKLPISEDKLQQLIRKHGTPFYLYDEKEIIQNGKNLLKEFSWNNGFKEFFAVKANPNPYLIKKMLEIGFGVDCSSLCELLICEKLNVSGSDIMFTSSMTSKEEYQKAFELGAIINIDDISHIAFILEFSTLPETLCFRYNPGKLKKGNHIIGDPVSAKFGMTKDQILGSIKKAKELGTKKFGLHTMVASNELDYNYFIETAEILFSLVKEVKEKLDVDFSFLNLGGGLGIPYHPDQDRIDLNKISEGIQKHYDKFISDNNLAPFSLFLESGRYITGPYGYLISKVTHIKDTYKKFMGLDACMVNLMRPGMYNAYHHIEILGNKKETLTYDVTGSLCENNDKFAIDRLLPETKPGDIAVIYDVGAHGHSMGFNYNGKLKCAELLLKTDGEVIEIRRKQTPEDYFDTIDFTCLLES